VLIPVRDPLAPFRIVSPHRERPFFAQCLALSIILSDEFSLGYSMRRSRMLSCCILCIGLFVALSTEFASAQWRIATPRDTVNVPANQLPAKTLSKLKLNSGVEAWLQVSGMFNFNVGGKSTFDGGYTISHPNWTIPTPIKNPPTYGNVKYDYGLRVITSLGLIEDWFKPIENFNNAHIYTSRVTCTGNDLWLYIKAPTAAHSQSATGTLNVKLARWTAGIAIKEKSIDFGGVYIGTPSARADSIASYGIDPLVVQNIQIFGPDSTDFSFVSQRDKAFTLPTEQTNEIKVIFSPSRRSDQFNPHTAYLVITSKNTDLPSREQIITLSGYGLQPDFGCLLDTLDFGKVRIGAPFEQTKPVNVCNPGNANLIVSPVTYIPVNYPAAANAFRKSTQTPIPMTVTPGSLQQIKNVFSPKARQKYIGRMEITTNAKKDSVVLLGEGAEPIPVFSKKKLTFGTVYNGDQVSDTFTVKNEGNWTATILNTSIQGDQVFSFSPADTAFIIDPGGSRQYVVTFHPKTTNNRDLHAWLIFQYDFGTPDSVELFGTEIQPPVLVSNHICDFGRVKIGASKDSVASKLRNTGNITQVSQQRFVPSTPFSMLNIIQQIEPNSKDSIVARFTPLVPGPAQSWLLLSFGGFRDSILFVGEGAVAKAVFTPNPLNFGTVPSNQQASLPILLTDSGNYPLRIIRFEITGPDKSSFQILDATTTPVGVTPLLPFTLLENTSLTIDVGFRTNAKTGAVHNATLCVYYDDGTFDCIPLQAIEEAQFLQFATAAVDFDKVRVKTSKQKDVSFKNYSNVELSVATVEATPASNAFIVVGTPTPVAPGQTMNVAVEFAPQYAGTFVGYAKASGGNFRTDSVQLRGIGAMPVPVFIDSIVDFGSVQLNAAFPGKTVPVTLLNKGNWDLTKIGVQLINNPDGEFGYSLPPGSDVIPPDSSITFDVTFTPTQTIVYHSADLVFTFDDSTTGVVHLIGLDESPNIVLGEKSVDFGRVRLKRSLTKQAHLINTTTKTLTASSMRIESGSSEFSSLGLPGTVVVSPNLIDRKLAVDITFAPMVRGASSAKLVIEGGDAIADTTILLGEGAEPVPVFDPKDMLDFGDVLYGIAVPRTFTIKNTGNWNFQNVTVSLTGPNAADFTESIYPTFLIAPDSVSTFSITFMATTALDLVNDRTATLTLTIDDSTEFTYELRARDREPFKTQLRFDNLYARPGDVIYPTLRLVNAVPDSLKIDHLEGVILYDPTVVNLQKVELGAMLANVGAWTLLEANPPEQTPGRYQYDLSSQTAWLSTPGPLLRLTFKALEKNVAGATSTLEHESFDYPQRKEVQALLTNGVIVIDSTCGATHVTAGLPKANYIEQSSPNPASISGGGTSLLFKVAADETPVSIRIMDVTGNEIARPIDGVFFQQGSYRLKVDGSTVRSSGMYFYEFRAGADKPVVRKMMLDK
jgi:hypothetical protein